MDFIRGNNRDQVTFSTLESQIEESNPVRFVDAFVEHLDLSQLGFVINSLKPEGRPAYESKIFLKIYLYGYLNGIRSSRRLERECIRNMELQWLVNALLPNYHSIADFRKVNSHALKNVFKLFVLFLKEADLIGGTTVAIDGTKLRAQNSKKNNFNARKIERHLAYIDNKLAEYNTAIELADEENKIVIQKQIQKQNDRKNQYHALTAELESTGEVQISTSDPDSRQLITRNNITEVAYNVQTVVDAKHNLPIDYKVTNENDSKAMGGMLRRTKVILNTTDFTALYDKGYHTGSEIKKAIELGIHIMVAVPEVASNAPDTAYNVANFKYDYAADCYTCPQEKILFTNGKWYNKDRGKSSVKVKHYKTHACMNCPVKDACTKNNRGRLIERTEHAPYIEQNQNNIDANQKLYKKRQAIVEHPYGILKRQWGFYYIMTKRGKKRASADVGLMFVAYNLRRIMNILDKNIFKKFLKELGFLFIEKLFDVNENAFTRAIPIFEVPKSILILRAA